MQQGIVGFVIGSVFLLLGYPKKQFYLQNASWEISPENRAKWRSINDPIYFSYAVTGGISAYILGILWGDFVSLSKLNLGDLFHVDLIIIVFAGIFFGLFFGLIGDWIDYGITRQNPRGYIFVVVINLFFIALAYHYFFWWIAILTRIVGSFFMLKLKNPQQVSCMVFLITLDICFIPPIVYYGYVHEPLFFAP